MKNFYISCITVIFILLSACSKDETTSAYFDRNYVVFGSFYGECGGYNCIEIFKIENGILYEDTSDIYPSNTVYEGVYFAQSQARYEQVKKLVNYIPPSLLMEPQGSIGGPDSHDQGGLYFELKVNYIRKFWKIDTDTAAIPHYLIPLTDTIKKYVQKLR